MSNIVLISVDGRHGSDSDASKKLDATRKALTKVFSENATGRGYELTSGRFVYR